VGPKSKLLVHYIFRYHGGIDLKLEDLVLGIWFLTLADDILMNLVIYLTNWLGVTGKGLFGGRGSEPRLGRTGNVTMGRENVFIYVCQIQSVVNIAKRSRGRTTVY